MNVKKIVAEYLKANTYDGLCCLDVPCGRLLEDLAPCVPLPNDGGWVRCRQCGKTVEKARECYATPVCYACMPPPNPMPVRPDAGRHEGPVVDECGILCGVQALSMANSAAHAARKENHG